MSEEKQKELNDFIAVALSESYNLGMDGCISMIRMYATQSKEPALFNDLLQQCQALRKDQVPQ